MPFRHDIAGTYHSVAGLNAMDFYPADDQGLERRMPQNQREDALVPAVGWVGRRYRPGGVAFIAINPGGGGDAYRMPREDDVELYRLMRAFRDAPPDQVSGRFDELCDGWMQIQAKNHGIHKPVSLVLEALGRDLQEAAFLDLVPVRTREDRMPTKAMVQASWERFTRPLIERLRPGLVIFLGMKASRAFSSLHVELGAPHETFKRTRGDRSLSPKALDLLERLRLPRAA